MAGLTPAATACTRHDASLEALLRSTELLDATTTRRTMAIPAGGRAVWFGLGLSGQTASQGLPVDVLALVLAQEMLRRALSLPASEVLLADTNALRSGIAPLDVQRARARAERTLADVARRWSLPLRILRASELDVTPLPRPVDTGHNDYVAEQLHQMGHMYRRGARVKLGWALSSSRLDERSFDRAFADLGVPTPMFVYGLCGRTLDARRPRACPYLCVQRSRRILLEPGEQVAAKLAAADPAPARGYRRLLGKIVRGQARLRGARPPRDPVAAIQGFIDALAPIEAIGRTG